MHGDTDMPDLSKETKTETKETEKEKEKEEKDFQEQEKEVEDEDHSEEDVPVKQLQEFNLASTKTSGQHLELQEQEQELSTSAPVTKPRWSELDDGPLSPLKEDDKNRSQISSKSEVGDAKKFQKDKIRIQIKKSKNKKS
jgi:hypothetical protein